MAKTGRPKTFIPMDVVDAACRLNATSRQTLEILESQGHKVSHNTLVREIRRVHGLSFEEYRDKRADLTRLKLIQKAVQMGLEGQVTMLIFSLKNLCGWGDGNEVAKKLLAEQEKLRAMPETELKKLALAEPA